MLRKSLLLGIVIVLCMAVSVPTSFAGSATFSGSIGAEDPTMPVVFISAPNCTGQGVFPVHYEAHVFSVDAPGMYSFTHSDNPSSASALYIMNGTFNPAGAFPNCIVATNSPATPTISANLDAGATYYVVVIDDQFDQAGVTYTVSAEGPGNIIPGANFACTYPLPANAVVYDVPAGAPAFYDADLSTKVNFDLPAGSWKISEFSGDFAKVWIACQAQPIWIPTNAIGAAIG